MKMNCSIHGTTLFLFLLIIGCFCSSRAFQITEIYRDAENDNYERYQVGEQVEAQVGDTTAITCRSDVNFDYCIWRHRNRTCTMKHDFSNCEDWMWNCYWGTCTGSNSTAFIMPGVKKVLTGETDSKNLIECSINWEIGKNGVKLTDAGKWSCEMGIYETHSGQDSVSDVKQYILNVAGKKYVIFKVANKNIK